MAADTLVLHMQFQFDEIGISHSQIFFNTDTDISHGKARGINRLNV